MDRIAHMPRFDMRRFFDEEDASLSVELVLILPLLLWGFLTVITIFDVFRARTLALKGNYAISDLLSRETQSINSSYLAGIDSVFSYLTQGGDTTWVRVTQVYCVDQCASNEDRELEVEWSHATAGQSTYTTAEMRQGLQQNIPLLPSGQYAIVVETSVDYSPPFLPPLNVFYRDENGASRQINWGIMKRNTFHDIVVTEPRFAPRLCWSNVAGCAP